MSRLASSAQRTGPSPDDALHFDDKPLPPPEVFRRANNSAGPNTWVTERGKDGGVISIGENGKSPPRSVHDLPLMLADFTVLHRNGHLEDAAETLQRALVVIGSSGDRVSNGADNFDQDALEGGGGEGAKDTVSAITISGVMNDLGCTFQQVGKLSTG